MTAAAPARRIRRDAAPEGGAAELIAAIIRGAPSLPGAACRSQPEAFDPPHRGEHPTDTAYRHRTALAICQRCPELARCTAWLDALPAHERPAGVIAGRINQP